MNLDLEEFSVINIDSKVRTLKYTKYDIRIYNSLSYRLIIDIQKGFSKFREAFYLGYRTKRVGTLIPIIER